MRHLDEFRKLWAELVPEDGQAETRQGEMIRAVEKLRTESLRNGYANWDDDFEHFVRYLREHLTAGDAFSDQQKREINRDIDAIAQSDSPPLEDEPFDRVQDWVIEWTRANPDPIPHEKLTDLER
ncbi:hypothetical protein OJ997_34175 [Solirubrobacter phytolaccae]|uniref:Uncharacterized protein n=1 Tax=Solirubrobacter phytolaccae TaxID=1404360 RepID=A0A9X3SBC2_9ACTN|nr:hypothetical protein [Solirubrobacter phytolaccae]MDA0185404.1 hypothetical protein [Solirubrobacter phytolaccae]